RRPRLPATDFGRQAGLPLMSVNPRHAGPRMPRANFSFAPTAEQGEKPCQRRAAMKLLDLTGTKSAGASGSQNEYIGLMAQAGEALLHVWKRLKRGLPPQKISRRRELGVFAIPDHPDAGTLHPASSSSNPRKQSRASWA